MNIQITDLEQIEELAACNYTPAQMAVFLDVDKKEFTTAFYNENHEVHRAVMRGKLSADIEINQKLLANAKAGNITAIQIYQNNRESKELKTYKEKLFYGQK